MTTSTPPRRSIHTPGSPSDMKGSRKPATNPDGQTPVDLPSGKTSLHDQKPPAPQAPEAGQPAEREFEKH